VLNLLRQTQEIKIGGVVTFGTQWIGGGSKKFRRTYVGVESHESGLVGNLSETGVEWELALVRLKLLWILFGFHLICSNGLPGFDKSHTHVSGV